MSTIYLFHGNNLSLPQLNLVHASVKMVPGTRLVESGSLRKILEEGIPADSILLFPILLPKKEQMIQSILKECIRHKPYAEVFSVCLLLLANGVDLTDSKWALHLDSYYEQAFPSCFCPIARETPASFSQFLLASQISALSRQMDSMGEIKKLMQLLDELTMKVNTLELRVHNKS